MSQPGFELWTNQQEDQNYDGFDNDLYFESDKQKSKWVNDYQFEQIYDFLFLLESTVFTNEHLKDLENTLQFIDQQPNLKKNLNLNIQTTMFYQRLKSIFTLLKKDSLLKNINDGALAHDSCNIAIELIRWMKQSSVFKVFISQEKILFEELDNNLKVRKDELDQQLTEQMLKYQRKREKKKKKPNNINYKDMHIHN